MYKLKYIVIEDEFELQIYETQQMKLSSTSLLASATHITYLIQIHETHHMKWKWTLVSNNSLFLFPS